MNKGIPVRSDGSGFSLAVTRHSDGKPASWLAPRVPAFITVAAASVLWAIAWMLALSD